MSTLYLYNSFNKRINSTKRPSTADASVSIDLLDVESLSSPRFRLSASYLGYTYALFEGRYYFLDEPEIINGSMIIYRGRLDLLATYRSEIEATEAFIQYSSNSSYYNVFINDERISSTRVLKYTSKSKDTGTSGTRIFDEHMCWATVVIAGCSEKATYGGSNAWQMDPGELQSLIAYVINDTDSIKTLFELYLTNPFSAFIKVTLTPFKASAKADNSDYLRTNTVRARDDANWASSSIVLPDSYILVNNQYLNGVPLMRYGMQTVDQNGETMIPQTRIRRYWKLAIPHHYADFRDYGTYSKYVLYLPYYGCVDFDITNYMADTNISIEAFCDVFTGDLVYRIAGDTSGFLEYYRVNVGIDVPLSQIKSNALMGGFEAGIGALSIAGGALLSMANPVSGVSTMVGGVTGLTKGIIDSMKKDIHNVGGTGGFSKIFSVLGSASDSDNRVCWLQQYYYETAENPNSDDFIATNGRPVEKVVQISSLGSGYVKCKNASIECNASYSEKEEINSHLNGGFYYE